MEERKDLTDSEIKNLWQDENFFASFSGINNFKAALFTTFGQNISAKRIKDILNDIPSYVSRIKPRKRFPRRPYDVYGFGQLLQADLAVMFKFEEFYYFLLVIDVFSRRIFCEPLKRKTSVLVKEAFNKIFDEINNPIRVLQTDQGAEFKGLKKYFEEKDIRHQYKIGFTKCTFAENAIYLIKLRLYTALRSKNSRDWPSLLKNIVLNYNNTPQSALKNLKPSDFSSSLDDVKLPDEPKEPNFIEQFKNQKEYEKNSNLPQKGDYCFLGSHPPTKVFEKSFDLIPGQLYKIKRVKAGFKPYLYKLQDLKGREKAGYYYREQLIIRKEPPQPGTFFQVEKILGKRKSKGKVQYLVKYLNYDDSFNKWINEEDLFKD
jgi:Integrase core domain/Chromo (CHRromatin Organisation MOdifier) domain